MNLEPGYDGYGPTEAVRLGLQSGADAYERFLATQHVARQGLSRATTAAADAKRDALRCVLNAVGNGIPLGDLKNAIAALERYMNEDQST